MDTPDTTVRFCPVLHVHVVNFDVNVSKFAICVHTLSVHLCTYMYKTCIKHVWNNVCTHTVTQLCAIVVTTQYTRTFLEWSVTVRGSDGIVRIKKFPGILHLGFFL